MDAGTIEAGKRADLLLLAADLFEDIGNLNRRVGVTGRVGVMADGRWYSQSRLMALVDA